MINPDEIREQIAARADEWRERKEELRERFVERIDAPAVNAAIGLSLVGAGMGAVIANLFRGRRSAWAYLLPAVFVFGGIAIMGGGALSRRTDRISAAEDVVREQLAKLDPIARAQVLRSAAAETVAPLIHRGATN